MRRQVRILAVLSLAVVGFALPVTTAAVEPGSYQVRLWLLPTVDQYSYNACLTNPLRWHSTDARFDYMRALDWKATCGANGSEPVRFRALGADLTSTFDYTSWNAMYGVVSNLSLDNCPNGGKVHLGKLKLFGGDGVIKGYMIYAHTVLSTSPLADFDIGFKRGASRSNAQWNSQQIGNTVSDALGGAYTDCWQGWHVHEINSDDAVMYWDSWNPDYNYPAALCDCYANNDHANWIRRMTTWVHLFE